MSDPRPPAPFDLRAAKPGEAAELSSLAVRAKAHWGYDAAFMAAAAADLTLTEDDLLDGETTVAEQGGRAIGWSRLRLDHGVAVLEDLWVAPADMGSGAGRALCLASLATALGWGHMTVELDADPNAVGFYQRLGAVVIGRRESPVVAGRMLPRMRFELG